MRVQYKVPRTAPTIVVWATLIPISIAALGYLFGVASISPAFFLSFVSAVFVWPYFKARSEGREATLISSSVQPTDSIEYQVFTDVAASLLILIANAGSLYHSLSQAA